MQRNQREPDEPLARGTAIIGQPVVVIAKAGSDEIAVVEAEDGKEEAGIQHLGTDSILILIGYPRATPQQALSQTRKSPLQNFFDVWVGHIFGHRFVARAALDTPAGVEPASRDSELCRWDPPAAPSRDDHCIDLTVDARNSRRFVAEALPQARENLRRFHHVGVRGDRKSITCRSCR